mmetsp:Transcript_14418/g.24589  ORF Transcript_14418/g.24589 Transcript_14418/m.24589 type:complete len:204 (-) Transcript_14418:653-1264(-)
MVMWTGDVVPHDIWNQHFNHTTTYVKAITDYLRENLKGAQIYGIMGNHDFDQLNAQDMTEPFGDLMLQYTGQLWSEGPEPLLFEEQAIEDFKRYGYFSQRLRLLKDKSYNGKVNVIGLNTQASYINNFLLFKSKYDPGEQLEWLEAKLREMEAGGEAAIILAHIPMAKSDFVTEWSLRFRALMERYQHVIRFVMHGHTHEENY